MREQINTLRWEWIVFEEIYEKLTIDLKNKKDKCALIVDIANNANTDREKATKELAELIKEAEQEKAEFDKNMKNVNDKILEERAKKEALKQKE